ncbi:hypothetical protein PPERSA_04702 [Pseudocohnilembus persalinus]|uniref:GAF domain-containing protein n=1 Tax=Pseudocohnilembus persalinus TaxID=266149 RepID=A0A0V0R4I7_PSEPJ|nr:hypothetical protein PPERSA_04702 [Pseudocohnilembus persalinus]|eukprot:KRX09396.1 hypothetical protein PPERSA_04702 [Pseudocohnilembus persalinus]
MSENNQNLLLPYQEVDQQIQDLIKHNLDLKYNQEQMFEKVIQLVYHFEQAVNTDVTSVQEQQMKRLRDSIKDLMKELGKASTTELELTQARLEKKKDEWAQEQAKTLKDYHQEKKNSEESQKKIESLEKRIEYILETDFTKVNDGHYQRVVTELVQENEMSKKQISRYERENKNLRKHMEEINLKLQRVSSKLELMKKKISSKDLESVNEEHQQQLKNMQTQPYQQIAQINEIPKGILQSMELPKNLNFRFFSLKQTFANLLNDITEQGSTEFTNQVLNQKSIKKQKESIMLVTRSFLSFKEVGDNLTTMHKIFIEMDRIRDLKTLMVFLQDKFKPIFISERCNLWILDRHAGFYYTTKQGNKNEEIRALYTKGEFSKQHRKQKAINKNVQDADEIVLYQSVGEKKQFKIIVDSTLCIPIFRRSSLNQNDEEEEKQIYCGILEISNSKSDDCKFSYDEEFYGVILAQQISNLLSKISFERQITAELNYNGYFYEAFCDFLKCQNRFQLFYKINEWIANIFSTVSHRFYFVENSQTELVRFDNMKKEKIIYSTNQGACGYAVKNNEIMCIDNIKQSPYFNSHIDVNTILPVYVIPLREQQSTSSINEENKSKINGVVEIVVKKQYKVQVEKEKLLLGSSPIVGVDDSFEHCLNIFGKFLTKAISIFPENFQ